jgi:hypothetical protein
MTRSVYPAQELARRRYNETPNCSRGHPFPLALLQRPESTVQTVGHPAVFLLYESNICKCRATQNLQLPTRSPGHGGM